MRRRGYRARRAVHDDGTGRHRAAVHLLPPPPPLGTAALRHPPARSLPAGLRMDYTTTTPDDLATTMRQHWRKPAPGRVTGRSRAAARAAPPRASPRCWLASDRPPREANMQVARNTARAGYGRSPVGDGGRGLGAQGGGLRHPQRAEQLPGVRCDAPSARRRCRRPAARRGVRIRARDRAGSPARRFLLRYRRLGQAGRGGPGPEPGMRHQARRYARPAVGPGVVRRRHQLPGDLGHHTPMRWPRSTGSFAPADAPGSRCGVT